MSPLKVAVSDPKNPKEGFTTQTISHGRSPRTKNTAIRIPHTKKNLLAFCPIVESTSALIMALSILEIISKRQSPKTVRRIERIMKNESTKNVSRLL